MLFVEVRPGDVSEFSGVLHVAGATVDRHRVLRCVSPAIPNAIAALLLYVRDQTGKIPHAYFGWTEGNPIVYLMKFLAFGEGDTAPVTREVLRQAEPNPLRRPGSMSVRQTAASSTPWPFTAVTSNCSRPNRTLSPTTGWPAEQRQHQAADAVDVLVLEIEVELLPDLVDAASCPARAAVPRDRGRPAAPVAGPSSISPTTSSNRSSSVTMPAVPPCSSMTTAICVRSRRIMSSTSSSSAVSGTTGTGRACAAVIGLVLQEQAQQILDVDHADDVIEIRLVDGIARVRRAARAARGSPRVAADRDARRCARAAPSPAPPSGRRTRTAPAASGSDSARSAPSSSLSWTISCSSSGV